MSTTLERELQLSKGTLRTMLKRLSSSKEGKVAIVGKHAKAGGGPQAHIWGLPGSIPSSSLANAGAVVEAPPKPQPPTRPLAPMPHTHAPMPPAQPAANGSWRTERHRRVWRALQAAGPEGIDAAALAHNLNWAPSEVGSLCRELVAHDEARRHQDGTYTLV